MSPICYFLRNISVFASLEGGNNEQTEPENSFRERTSLHTRSSFQGGTGGVCQYFNSLRGGIGQSGSTFPGRSCFVGTDRGSRCDRGCACVPAALSRTGL